MNLSHAVLVKVFKLPFTSPPETLLVIKVLLPCFPDVTHVIYFFFCTHEQLLGLSTMLSTQTLGLLQCLSYFCANNRTKGTLAAGKFRGSFITELS